MRTRTHSSRSSTPRSDSSNGFPPADGRTATLSGLTTLAILGVAFGALALGLPYFWIVFPVGFGGVLPLVLAYSRRTARDESATDTHVESTADSTTDEALRTLRARYARGELTDEAFERRLERLLETETVAEATTWTRRTVIENEDGDDDEGDVHDEDSKGDSYDEGTGSA